MCRWPGERQLDPAEHRELGTAGGRSGDKAALIRLLLSQRREVMGADPVDALIGAGDGDPVEDIDAVVYDR